MPVPFLSGLFYLLALGAGWLLPCGVHGADPSAEATATVVIRGRQFQPEKTVLRQGQKTVLVFQNQDSELHTFAPVGLLVGESFNVAGNGAPEFGPDGFKRVILPADGKAEIRFTPRRAGEYRYVCDMPGHQMSGVIIVE